MTDNILRTKQLILKGRFQNHISKSLNRFDKIEGNEKLVIGEEVYTPYHDKNRNQIVFARIEGKKVHALYVSHADYTFGANDDFEWFNA